MIRFRDFEAEVLKSGGLMSLPRMKSLSSALTELNRWVEAENVEVINVETVVLPNVGTSENPTSQEPRLVTSPKLGSTWSQIVRVWYRAP